VGCGVAAAAAMVGREFRRVLFGGAEDSEEEESVEVAEALVGEELVESARRGALALTDFSEATLARDDAVGLSCGTGPLAPLRPAAAALEVRDDADIAAELEVRESVFWGGALAVEFPFPFVPLTRIREPLADTRRVSAFQGDGVPEFFGRPGWLGSALGDGVRGVASREAEATLVVRAGGATLDSTQPRLRCTVTPPLSSVRVRGAEREAPAGAPALGGGTDWLWSAFLTTVPLEFVPDVERGDGVAAGSRCRFPPLSSVEPAAEGAVIASDLGGRGRLCGSFLTPGVAPLSSIR